MAIAPSARVSVASGQDFQRTLAIIKDVVLTLLDIVTDKKLAEIYGQALGCDW